MDEDMHKKIGRAGVVLLVIYIILAAQFEWMADAFTRFSTIIFAFRKNVDIVYALIPVYLNWMSADYFQERRGTGLGNAATNGFTGVWVGIDWIRSAHHRFLYAKNLQYLMGKLFFAFLMLTWGIVVVREAVKGKKIAKYIGRVREISYFGITITAIVYEVVRPDRFTLFTILLFFPLVYCITEFVIYYLLPAPKTEEDEPDF